MRLLRLRRRLTPLAAVILLLALVALAAPAALADELEIGGVTHRNLRITALREDVLLYETAGGARRQVSVDAIDTIRLRRHPEMAEAEQLAQTGAYADAAEHYRQVLDALRAEDLQVLVHAKLVASLDAAGQAEQAVSEFLALLERDRGPIAQAAQPRRLPGDADERAELAQLVRQRIMRTADAQARRPMHDLLNRLEADPEDEAAAASSGGARLVGPREESEDNDAVDALIDRGEYREGLAAVEQAVEEGNGPLARRLYQRGVILSALGEDREAALSLMRVVIHYPSTRNPYHIPSLIEAGKVFVDMNQPEHARRLWEEAREAASDEDERLAEIDQLLGSLP